MAWMGKAEGQPAPGWKPMLVGGGQFLLPSRAQFVVEGDDGSPNAVAVFELRKGRPHCVEVNIRASRGGRAVQASDFETFKKLEGISRRVFIEAALTFTEQDAESGESLARRPTEAERVEIGRLLDQGLSRKRPPSDAELRRVAEMYVAHQADAPLEHIRGVLGVSWRTAARRVRAARDRGFLAEEGGEDA